MNKLEIVYLPVSALQKLPGNPRKDVDQQAITKLAKLITAHGFQNPLQVFKENGKHTIIAGNHRFDAGLSIGMTEFPCIAYDGDKKAALARAVSDNKSGEWTDWDMPLLKDLIIELDDGAFDINLTGFTVNELELMMTAEFQGEPADAEPQIDQAEELNRVWQVKAGDLWQIGEHRLLCGDSTKAKDVARVLMGDVPFLCVTDPPYGVNYDANWRNEADRANGKSYGARAVGRVTNDDRADWRQAWQLFPGDVIYSWHPPGATSLIHADALQASGFQIRMQIIWAKNHFPIGRGDYHVKHEPCWYCVRDGKAAKFTDDRTQNTLWEIDKPNKSETGHSTQKPLECMARPIRNHESEFIYDPFLGSGTTMVASQNLTRKCRGIEISPNYCAVILQRMKDAFNITGERL